MYCWEIGKLHTEKKSSLIENAAYKSQDYCMRKFPLEKTLPHMTACP